MVQKDSDERREFVRFNVGVPVCCKVDDQQAIETRTRDISSQGLSFKWKGSFPDLLPGVFLRLEINEKSISQPLETLARVVWIKKGKSFKNSLGLCFIEEGKSEIPRIISYGGNFYWDIFKKTGSINAYLLYKMEPQ
ncbi:MAG: PilZ domain-containing protein [bacterium]